MGKDDISAAIEVKAGRLRDIHVFVGDSNIIHVSKSRPFWNKCLFIGMVWFTVTLAKTTLVEHIPTINEDPTALPSFLDEGQKALHV